MEPEPRDPGDFLESSVLLDETQYEEGFRDGYNDGLISGKAEGRGVGLKLGFQVGEELGFYRGCIDFWISAARVDPGAFSSRLQKSIEQLDEMVDKYPLFEPENVGIQEMMDAIRLKFRLISANLGVKLEYEGYPKSSKHDVEDIYKVRGSQMLKSMLTCCKLYISESRNALALESIEQAAKLYPEAVVINRFKDEPYNRVGYTLVAGADSSTVLSFDCSPLRKSVFSMVRAALEAIDLELHSGTHPRLGVVDHICFHPLAEASLDQAAGIARSVATDIGYKLQVPTFLYGAAHPGGRRLDAVRRELGYFKPNSSGNQWVGGPRSESLQLKPDEGPHQSVLAKGVVVVGATPWVDNYNVPVYTADIEAVRRIARRVSSRGGGLDSVQAMGLAHGEDSTEVACNLLDPKRVGADQVQSEVERLASEEGLVVGKGYYTDFSEEKIIEMYMNQIQSN